MQTYRAAEGKTRGGPTSLLFRSDGTFEVTGPGKVDRPGSLTGRWRSDPGDPTRITVETDVQTIEYRIIEVGEDELRLEELARPSPPSPPR